MLTLTNFHFSHSVILLRGFCKVKFLKIYFLVTLFDLSILDSAESGQTSPAMNSTAGLLSVMTPSSNLKKNKIEYHSDNQKVLKKI